MHWNMTGDKLELQGSPLNPVSSNIFYHQRFSEFKTCYHPSVYIKPSFALSACHGLKYSGFFITKQLNLHSHCLYISSYILHTNRTINTPTHLSDASLWFIAPAAKHPAFTLSRYQWYQYRRRANMFHILII